MKKYLPFLNGEYSVAPALQPAKKIDSCKGNLVFDIDECYKEYWLNKEACRKEDINKYYVEKSLVSDTVVRANQYIVNTLLSEYPKNFTLVQNGNEYVFTNYLQQNILKWKEDWIQIEDSKYLSLFDALASQIQEDLAICQLKADKDYLAAVHVCSPNYWSPGNKAGGSFNQVHAIVPGMGKGMQHYFKMLTSIITKGPFIRFAWGITTDNRLNHHPLPAAGVDEALWKGRKIEAGCELFCRVEKQTLIGLPENNAFLFLIRTYHYPVSEFMQHEKMALVSAIETMSLQSLEYKNLTGKVEIVKQMLL